MDRNSLFKAFRELDRSLFLDDACKGMAAYDEPLPIGYGQTISQPSLVAEMTALLDPEPDSVVLEIGTGSGFQTALLSRFFRKVFTVERIPELSEKARKRLAAMGLNNISYLIGDGSKGWAEKSPFNRIIVTAAASVVPPDLTEQLAPGGRMVIPVGPPVWQDLLLITKDIEGSCSRRAIEKVAFVELVGEFGW